MVSQYYEVKNRYMDSVLLMLIGRELEKDKGVTKAGLMTATKENMEVMRDAGFSPPTGLLPSSILIAVEADSEANAKAAIQHSKILMDKEVTAEAPPETLPRMEDISKLVSKDQFPVLFISTPGEYVEGLADEGLDQGMNLHIFSSNVPREAEVRLKKKGKEKGLLVMGPDAGTVIIHGAGIGFANAVQDGDLAVVGSAGSGMQEVTVLLDKAGQGVSFAIGVGSKDMSKEVGGIMSKMALDMMPKDHTVIVIGKTPDEAVKREIVGMIKGRPSAFIALGSHGSSKEGATMITGSMDEGVNYVLKALGRIELKESNPESTNDLKGRKLLRGLFVGGSLCYQAQAILMNKGIKVYSNAPATKEMTLPEKWDNVNVCIDTGAEEYVKGRPHPMIDPVARNSMLVKDSARKEVAVLLFEVMLGWGSAMDPLEGLNGLKKGPLAIASLCGTHRDKQDYEKVRRGLEDLGVVVFNSAGNAAEYAANVMEGLK